MGRAVEAAGSKGSSAFALPVSAGFASTAKLFAVGTVGSFAGSSGFATAAVSRIGAAGSARLTTATGIDVGIGDPSGSDAQ